MGRRYSQGSCQGCSPSNSQFDTQYTPLSCKGSFLVLAFAWACNSEGLTSLQSGFDCAHPPCLGFCVQAEKKARQREKEKERKRAAAEKKAKAAEGARAAAEAEVTTAAAEAAALAARCAFV